MPAHRKATAVLKASGAIAKDPKRYKARGTEPVPAGPLGAAPKHFTKAEAAIWQELASMALPGVLSNSDRWAVELACGLMRKARSGSICTGEISQLTILLGKLGLTPADRSKVHGSKQEEKDEWDSFSTVQ